MLVDLYSIMLKGKTMVTLSDNSGLMDWINAERKKRGWTARHAALQAGISPTQLYYVEVGKRRPGIKMCIRFAKLFNTPREFVYQLAKIYEMDINPDEAVKRGNYYLSAMRKKTTINEALNYLEYLVTRETNEDAGEA